jgi:thymidylate synthase
MPKSGQMLEMMEAVEADIMLDETKTTYEMVAASLHLKDLDHEMLKIWGLNVIEASLIYNTMKQGLVDVEINGYITAHYVDMFNQIKTLAAEKKDIESRQFIISFPVMHCIQSIQILYRHNRVIVILNMRSCDFKKKFLYDLFIAHSCGADLAKEMGVEYEQIDMVVHIGSLHIYKEDVR